MILRSSCKVRCVLNRTPNILVPPKISALHFSQSACCRNGTPSPKNVKFQKSAEKTNTNAPPQAKKRRSLAFPALALFAVAIPFGWHLLPRYSKAAKYAERNDFVKYVLVSKTPVSSTSAVFTLRPSTSTQIDLYEPEFERAITSVEIKQPQLQIARSYTILPQQQGQHEDELRFLIRREQKGEVSSWLHRLPVGSELEVRGLQAEYALPKDVTNLVFLAGGTGIAPALNAIDILNEDGGAYIHVLWANKRREEVVGASNDTQRINNIWSWWPLGKTQVSQEDVVTEKGALVRILEGLKKESAKQNTRAVVDYFVDEEGSFITAKEVKDIMRKLAVHNKDDAMGRKIILISGPEGFMEHWAGPKRWVDGREVQGPIRGVLSTIGLDGWEVYKL